MAILIDIYSHCCFPLLFCLSIFYFYQPLSLLFRLQLLGYDKDMRAILGEVAPEPGYLSARLVQPSAGSSSTVLTSTPLFPTASCINYRGIPPNSLWLFPPLSREDDSDHTASSAETGAVSTSATTSSHVPFQLSDLRVYDVNPSRESAPLPDIVLSRLTTETLFHIFYNHHDSAHRTQALTELYQHRHWFWHRDLRVFLKVPGKTSLAPTDKGVVFAQGLYYDSQSGTCCPLRDSKLVLSALQIVPLPALLQQFEADKLKFS